MTARRRFSESSWHRSRHVRAYRRSAAAFTLLFCAGIVSALPSRSAPAWQLLDDGEPTPGAWTLVYDTARQRPVMLVDSGANSLDFPQGQHPGNTWELVDGFWKRIFVPEPVPWVTMGCAAYDDARDVMVVFGTWTSNETWEYDGAIWTKRTPPASPPSRNRCGMVYDASRGRIVMFGGEDANFQPMGDHWEYDGTTWTQRTFNTIPSPRTEPAMAYDSARGVTVFFGGMLPLVGQGYSDTWEFDGTRWRQKSPSTVPPRRAGAGMAYDPIRARTVMFGGYTPTAPYSDTWEWNGSNWTEKFPTTHPDARRRAATIWDPSLGKVLIFGGEPADQKRNDTWTFDGTSWVEIADEPIPTVRYAHGLAVDPVRDRIVMYSGRDDDRATSAYDAMDTWFLVSSSWEAQVGANPASVRSHSRLWFDPLRDAVRGFSGDPRTGTTLHAEVYELDSISVLWTSQDYCCPGPQPVIDPAVAEAAPLGGTFVFGGQKQNGSPTSAFWAFSGTTWTDRTVSPSPTGRMDAGMAFDSSRNRLVLYGGQNGFGLHFGDTWSYDGSQWTQLFAESAPGPRECHSLVYDAGRDRIVLFGNGSGNEHVTWEFDGGQWLAVSTPLMPDATRAWSPLVYDAIHDVTWLFGGRRYLGSGTFNDTWAYGEDDDGDGKVGGLDNCRQIANPEQANGDGDKAGDVCDCAPADSSAFAAPLPVSGLALSGAGTTSLTWTDQSSAVGSGVRYDVAKGPLSELRSGSAAGATCLASQIAVASTSDGDVPAASDGFWYLVRARNACGMGGYGSASVDAAAPCP